MSKFSSRHVVLYDLPLAESETILHPEQVLLRFGNSGSVDVGALCFLHRGPNNRKTAREGQKVDPKSFSQGRTNLVRNLIDYISEQYTYNGKRPKTQHIIFLSFVSLFMCWADANRHTEVLEGEAPARDALCGYVAYLRERVSKNITTNNTAARLQDYACLVLEGFLDIHYLMRGINRLRRNEQSTEPTYPPCENAQSKVLALCNSLYLGFTELVLERKSYPYCLKMPKYLDWVHDYLWIFPHVKWCMPPYQQSKRCKREKPYWGYDYANGQLATFEKIEQKYCNKYVAINAIKFAQKRLTTANNDHRDFARLQSAMLAHNAFIMLFVANTGMNMAQVLHLLWDGDYEWSIERQGFRTIKWRAAGRICFFEITTDFLPRFKLYLQIREYILKRVPNEYLFISLGNNRVGTPQKMGVQVLYSFYRTLHNIDPLLPTVTAREWRAAKSDWLIRNTDPSLAASILQNSEKTFLKHYAAGSATAHMDEMSSFLKRVAETVVNRGQFVDQGFDRAVGFCSLFGAPNQLEGNVSVTPDCRDPQGCLFCDKFKVHADERDTRKLLSCRFCLQKSSHLASSEEQFQKLFEPILERIQHLLDEINLREEGMVVRIKREVEEEGELDQYWASKLELLMELGLVS